MRFRHLATTLAVAMALLILLSLGVMTSLAVRRSAAALRDRALATNQALALASAQVLEQYMVDAPAIVSEATSRPKFHAEILGANWRAAEVVLRDLMQHFQQFDSMSVLDEQGILRVRVPHSETVGQDFSAREFFQSARQTRQATVSNAFISGATRRPFITVTAPVLRGDGSAAAGGLDLQNFTRFINPRDSEMGRTIAVLDRRGVTLAASDASPGPPTLTPDPSRRSSRVARPARQSCGTPGAAPSSCGRPRRSGPRQHAWRRWTPTSRCSTSRTTCRTCP